MLIYYKPPESPEDRLLELESGFGGTSAATELILNYGKKTGEGEGVKAPKIETDPEPRIDQIREAQTALEAEVTASSIETLLERANSVRDRLQALFTSAQKNDSEVLALKTSLLRDLTLIDLKLRAGEKTLPRNKCPLRDEDSGERREG